MKSYVESIMDGNDDTLVRALARNTALFTYGETDEEFVANALHLFRLELDSGVEWKEAHGRFKDNVSHRKRNSRLAIIVGNHALSRTWMQMSRFGLHFRTKQL